MNRPEHYESDLLFYFDGKPREFSLYQRLFESMEQAFPDASVKVQKSQISFTAPNCLPLPLSRYAGKRTGPGNVCW